MEVMDVRLSAEEISSFLKSAAGAEYNQGHQDRLLLAVSTLRRSFQNHDSKRDINDDLINNLFQLMNTMPDKFTLTACRDAIIEAQSSLFAAEEPLLYHQVSTLYHNLQNSAATAAALRNSFFLTTLMDISTDFILHVCDNHDGYTDWFTLLSMYWSISHGPEFKCDLLALTATYRSLAKILKRKRILPTEIKSCFYDRLCNVLRDDDMLNRCDFMLWKAILKCIRRGLQYEHADMKDINSPEEALLSQYIVNERLLHIVNNLPLTSCCGSSWYRCYHSADLRLQTDVSLMRSALVAILYGSVRFLANLQQDRQSVLKLLNNLTVLSKVVSQKLHLHSDSLQVTAEYHPWFFDLFLDQDDMMGEALMSLLNVCSIFSSRWAIPPTEVRFIEPLTLFSGLLMKISYDHKVLLDLILSPETCFLTYFSRFLHYLLETWHHIIVQQALDDDVDIKPNTSELVSLTSGLECLMSYNEMSDEDTDRESSGESSSGSNDDNDAGASRSPSLSETIKVLIELKESLIHLTQQRLCPFKVDHLIRTLHDIQVKAYQSHVN